MDKYEKIEKIERDIKSGEGLLAQGKLLDASKKFSAAIKDSISILNEDLAIRAYIQAKKIQNRLKDMVLNRLNQAGADKERVLANRRNKRLIKMVEEDKDSLLQKGEKYFQKREFKKAALSFLKASLLFLELGESEKSKETLEKVKMAKMYIN
ncbi:MAG TPA: hypothetical protein VMV49_00235 [Candidatus Deferrimicrobium sp.]|nr:hypothetical protein [Candidatus Deferrimicrobium sp.]